MTEDLDVPFIDGQFNQEREYWYNKIVSEIPALKGHPEALYGNNRLLYLRLVNEGLIDDQYSSASPEDVAAALQNPGPARDALNAQTVDTAGDPASRWGATLMQTYAQPDGTINAQDRRFGLPKTKHTLINALDAAEAAGKGVTVRLGHGTWELDTGLSMAGRTAALLGVGATGNITPEDGTVLKASNQSGPVLDYTDWKSPEGFLGKLEQGNFNVIGSNQSDPTKQNSGIRFKTLACSYFHDISVRKTGGPGIEGIESPGVAVYLNDFARIVLGTPVDSGVNDVPYMILNEANGNRFQGIALRSRNFDGLNDCGKSGAIVVKGNSQYGSRINVWDSCWVEYIHVPTDGTIFHVEASMHTFTDTIFWDVYKETGATNTSHMRFLNAPAQNYGGNIVRGQIPGRTSGTVAIDWGIDSYQSGLHIEGVKGYNGYNVRINPGVKNNYVSLGGSMNEPSNAGVVDNSGNNTNTILDSHSGDYKFGVNDKTGGTGPTFEVMGIPEGRRFRKLDFSGNTSLSANLANVYEYTVKAPGGITSITGGKTGMELTLIVKQDATGGHDFYVAGATGVKWDGASPVFNTTAGGTTIIKLYYDGANWLEISRSGDKTSAD